MKNCRNAPGIRHLVCLVLITLLASLLLSACGEDGTPTQPTPKDNLPLDRALILSNRDGWPDLYTVDLSGKINGRLTESAAAEYGASWSPDGKKVVFTELNGDQAAGDYAKGRQIVVIDANGQNRRVVAQDGFGPVWSPDGQKILFTRVAQSQPASQSSAVQPYAANIVAAANPTNTPSPGFTVRSSATEPAPYPTVQNSGPPPIITQNEPTPVAPAGNTGRVAQAALYMVNLDNGQPTLLVQDAVAGAFSPDGKQVVYIGGNNQLDQKRTLNLLTLDGNTKISLTERAKLSDLDVLYAAWSPDGKTLAFTATDPQKNKTSLYRISPESTTARRLADYDGSARELMSLIWAYADYYNPASRLHLGPAWSPNGLSIAFTDGSSRLSVVDAVTGNTRYFPVGAAALGQDKNSVLSVSWLADSRRLLYDRASAGRTGLLTQAANYIYDFFDETLETLDTLNKNTLALSTGSKAAFLPSCCGMDLLGAGDPATTPTAKLSPTATTGGQPTRDGKLVYVSGIGLRQLIVSDLKTGSQKVISSGPFKLIDFNLAPDGGQMIYVEVGERFNSALYLTGLDGGQKRKLSEGGGNPDDLSLVANWSPDGKHIAFQALNNDPNLKPGLYSLTIDDKGNPTGDPRLITSKDVSAFTWSPDSRYVAYKIDANQYELWVTPVDGSSKEQLLAAQGHFDNRYSSLGRGLAWSPDGRYLAMSGAGGSSYGNLWQIWLVTPQGKVQEQSSYYINRLIGFSPDSSRLIATVASTGQSSSIQALLMPSGTNISRGWRSYDRGYGPISSPDSVSLAYYSWADDGRTNGQPSTPATWHRVMMINFATGLSHPINLNYAPYYSFKARFFAWDPTGKNLAFYENNTIYLASAQGNQQKQEVLARAFVVDRLAWAK